MKVSVKAHPKSRQAKVVKTGEGAFEIWVQEPPDKGRANDAVRDALAGALGVARSSVRIVSGEASRNKIFRVAV